MRPRDEFDEMEATVMNQLEQGAKNAEIRAAHKQINAQQRLLALLRDSLEYAEQCAADGDTHGILAAISDMRRQLGMPTIEREPQEWTTADILAHAG